MTLRRYAIPVVATPIAILAACRAFENVPPPSAAQADAADSSAVDAATAGLLPTDVAAKVCSLVAECPNLGESIARSLRIPLTVPRWSYCMHLLTMDVDPSRVGKSATVAKLGTIADSASCVDAAAQLGQEVIEELDPRCGATSNKRYCLDGNTFVDCQLHVVHHCGEPPGTSRLTCQSFDGGAWCGFKTGCTNAACVNGSVLLGCGPNEGNATQIDKDVSLEIDCTAFGETCRQVTLDGGDLIAQCWGGRPLDDRFQQGPYGACDGDVLVQMPYAYAGYFDCASVGGHCLAKDKGSICTFPDDECTPFDADLDECGVDGDTMSVCVGGRRSTFSCATIGKRCVSDATKPIRSACR